MDETCYLKPKRWGEIQRLGIAGFVTETGDCCLDLADEISKYFPLYFVHVWRISLGDVWCGGGREIVLWCFLDLTNEIR